jgi:hypothetical protein
MYARSALLFLNRRTIWSRGRWLNTQLLHTLLIIKLIDELSFRVYKLH